MPAALTTGSIRPASFLSSAGPAVERRPPGISTSSSGFPPGAITQVNIFPGPAYRPRTLRAARGMLRDYAVKASVARRVANDVAAVSRAERLQGPGRAERAATCVTADPGATARRHRRAEPDLDIRQGHGLVSRPRRRSRAV